MGMKIGKINLLQGQPGSCQYIIVTSQAVRIHRLLHFVGAENFLCRRHLIY
jgi:hypothetical protein